MKKIFSPLFSLSAFLFPFVLVLYLVLFLLENVFPGFVSNNFDLNYFLIPVIFFGFLAAFTRNEPSAISNQDEQKSPTRWDFILIAGLTVLSFVILVYKTSDLGLTGFIVSSIGSILILLMSLVIVFPSREKESVAPENHTHVRNFHFKKFLFSHAGLSATGLVVLIIIGGFAYDIYFHSPSKPSAISSQPSVVSI